MANVDQLTKKAEADTKATADTKAPEEKEKKSTVLYTPVTETTEAEDIKAKAAKAQDTLSDDPKARGIADMTTPVEGMERVKKLAADADETLKVLKELYNNLNPTDIPVEIIEKVRSGNPPDFIKQYPAELIQFNLEKYNKNEALARTTVMSMIGGMFQAASGTKGVVATAGTDSLATGLIDISQRQELVDARNRQLQEKNAMLAEKYYDNAMAWAQDYNKNYNAHEKQNNDLIITLTQEAFKASLDKIKALDTTMGRLLTAETTTRTTVQTAITARDTTRQRAEIERSKERRDIERIKTDRAKTYMDTIMVASQIDQAYGSNLNTDKVAQLTADALMTVGPKSALLFTAANMSDKELGGTKPYIPLINETVNQQVDIIKSVFNKDIFRAWWQPGRSQDAKRALRTIMTFNTFGGGFTADGYNEVLTKLRDGKLDLQYSVRTGEITTTDPEIKKLVKKGEYYKGVSAKEIDNITNSYAQALNLAIKKKDQQAISDIQSEVGKLWGAMTDQIISVPTGISAEQAMKNGQLMNLILVQRVKALLTSDENWELFNVTDEEAAGVDDI